MPKGNMKSIKRRIKSVGSTLQITRAMEMVASSKLRRAKAKAAILRPYFNALDELLKEIAAEKKDFATIFTAKREVKNRLFIVIAGDRELAGGFNSNILRLVSSNSADDSTPPKIIAIGKRTVDYFKKYKHDIVAEYPYFAENVKASQCADIANIASDLFKTGEVDEVRIFYTAYISALRQDATDLKLLPFDTTKEKAEGITEKPEMVESSDHSDSKIARFVNYDPSPEAVFDRIIPMILLSIINCACVESFASEQSARRNAMESASDNAEEMIEKLSLQYNRARQEKITNEINEIVGGANAIS
ncbi:MAG: ATP synthase F1 subunit gamma [Oscillospiraceae bacterium]|nr:ATP synthase F1 subunit gamma [Oscillospiraceae bacterium]